MSKAMIIGQFRTVVEVNGLLWDDGVMQARSLMNKALGLRHSAPRKGHFPLDQFDAVLKEMFPLAYVGPIDLEELIRLTIKNKHG